MRTFLSILGFALAALTARAANPQQTLKSVPQFAFGGIGVAGTTSEGELAFRALLKMPGAEREFVKILQSGNFEGKCYALVALRSLNPTRYAEKVATYQDKKVEVTTVGGCIVAVLPMSSVVSNIDARAYDRFILDKP